VLEKFHGGWYDFHKAWTSLGAKGNGWNQFNGLLTHYAEPQRWYHTPSHLFELLQEYEQIKDEVKNPATFIAALFYHDSIYYTVRGSQNERYSADYMFQDMINDGISQSIAAEASDILMGTDHKTPAQTHDAKLLGELDLVIIGKPRAQYDLYRRDIRREYAHVPDDVFNPTRAEFMGRFDKRTLYTFEPLKQYEDDAHKNLQWEIKLPAA
jgi:predicted metal-dependent HD superfamily phosphohydrolase